jgi:hypothetical protein
MFTSYKNPWKNNDKNQNLYSFDHTTG